MVVLFYAITMSGAPFYLIRRTHSVRLFHDPYECRHRDRAWLRPTFCSGADPPLTILGPNSLLGLRGSRTPVPQLNHCAFPYLLPAAKIPREVTWFVGFRGWLLLRQQSQGAAQEEDSGFTISGGLLLMGILPLLYAQRYALLYKYLVFARLRKSISPRNHRLTSLAISSPQLPSFHYCNKTQKPQQESHSL